MEVFWGHARPRAITCDTVSPANRADSGLGDVSRDVAGVVSDVSVLCPRSVAASDNGLGRRVSNSKWAIDVSPSTQRWADTSRAKLLGAPEFGGHETAHHATPETGAGRRHGHGVAADRAGVGSRQAT